MNILCIDTSSQWCSAAIVSAHGLCQQSKLAPRQHAGLLITQVEGILKEASLKKEDLTAVAVCCGPGSFTGIRVAVAMAQGLAFAIGCPVIPISTLQAIAQGAFRKYDTQFAAVVIDARMDEVYWGGYEITDSHIAKEVMAPTLSKPKDVRFLSDKDWERIGNGWDVHSTDLIIGAFSSSDKIFSEDILEAQDLLPLARYLLEQGKTLAPEHLAPYYLRDRVVR